MTGQIYSMLWTTAPALWDQLRRPISSTLSYSNGHCYLKIIQDLKVQGLKLVSEQLSASAHLLALCSPLPQWPPVQLNTTSTLTGSCGFLGSHMTPSRKRIKTVPMKEARRRKTRADPRAADCGCRGTRSICPKWWRVRYRLCASNPN